MVLVALTRLVWSAFVLDASSEAYLFGTTAGSGFGELIGARRRPAGRVIAALELVVCAVFGTSGMECEAVAVALLGLEFHVSVSDSMYWAGLRMVGFGIYAAVLGATCGLVRGVRRWARWQEGRRGRAARVDDEQLPSVLEARSTDRSRRPGSRGSSQDRGRR